jgi:hypothetical protein
MNAERTVSKRALLRRINRKLAKKWEAIRTSRSWGERHNLGEYHLIDILRNAVIDSHMDPAIFAREIGVLHEIERVV